MFTAVFILLAFSPACDRSVRAIDDNDRVTLLGNVHHNARAEFDRGTVSSSLSMERMILALRRNPQKQAELDVYLAELHDPASSNFHHWLTPEEFGARFGVADDDINAITGWLRSYGFTIDQVARSRTWINFSGSAGDIERAFHTSIHTYFVNGRVHHANDRDPTIPRGLSDVVAGVVTLHDFPRKAMNGGVMPVALPGKAPQYTVGSTHYLSPSDFATIYNVNVLYTSGIDGSGQSIAIVGRTHPSSTNWTTFRSMMGLPSNPPRLIVNGPDPGDLGAAEDNEADLDVEWSGAVAKSASILFVVSKSTLATDGVDLSAQYIVNNNLAPVMSTSFGSCESDLGKAENAFYYNLWQQAAAQGITSFVSSGDSGAAGCDPGSASNGLGLGVNGLASTPYDIAVGGTEFNEGSGTYWNTTNGAGYSSALSYIPEIAWNESGSVSGGSGLWATGGGASSQYVTPAWQVAPGVPANNRRNVPDVSLNAAGHVAYLVQSQGALYAIRGTSASSPSFAGLMALVVQKTGQRQGNANTRFYQLGNAQYAASGVPVFHDIVSGNNTVPGVAGYTSALGYDLATGLGSVDAGSLVTNWTPDFTITSSPATLSIPQGSAGTSMITTTDLGNFNNAVSLSASLPPGVTASFSPNPIAAPGSGSSMLNLTVGASAPIGTFPVTVTGVASGMTHTASVDLIIPETFTITVVTNGSGTIMPATSTVDYGSPLTFTITPASGSPFILYDNGSPVSVTPIGNGSYTYTIGSVKEDHIIDVIFNPTSASPLPAIGIWGVLIGGAALGAFVDWSRQRNRHNPGR